MPINAIRPGPALDAAVRYNAVEGYEQAMTDSVAVAALLETVEPSDKEKETHVYRESAPLPRRKDKGDRVPYGSTKYESFEIVNRRYELGIQIHKDDIADDQTSQLRTEPNRVGAGLAQLKERIAFQMLLGTTDQALLPSVPNASDGLALFAQARFGQTDGNIVGSAGDMDTAALLRTAIFKGIMRRAAFTDTNGQPMVPPGGFKDLAIIYNIGLHDLMLEALKQELAAGRSVAGDFPNDALSQVFRQNQFRPVLVPTVRETSLERIHLSFVHAGSRTLKMQPREAMQLIPHPNNSGEPFEDDYYRWKVTERAGYGIGLPVDLIRVQKDSL